MARRVGGAIIALACGAFVAAGIMLYIYGSSDLPGSAAGGWVNLLKRFVYGIYRRTEFLGLVWDHAAVPDRGTIASAGTLAFLGWYLGFFFGLALVGTGNCLARRLRAADREIEATQTGHLRSGAEAETQPTVEIPSVWAQVGTLYVAPLAAGIVLLGLARLLA